MISKNKLLLSALRNIKGAERKLAALYLWKHLKLHVMPPPVPEVHVRCAMSEEIRKALEMLDCSETLNELIADIARATYLELAEFHHAKGRGDLYPRKNIIVNESVNGVTYSKDSTDEFQLIEFRAYQPDAYKLQDKVDELVKEAVNAKYSPKNKSEFTKKYFQICKELESNRFVDEGSGEIVYNLETVTKYLKNRATKEPRPVKCPWCNRLSYVFHPRRNFCYRASCKSSKSRAESKNS